MTSVECEPNYPDVFAGPRSPEYTVWAPRRIGPKQSVVAHGESLGRVWSCANGWHAIRRVGRFSESRYPFVSRTAAEEWVRTGLVPQ